MSPELIPLVVILGGLYLAWTYFSRTDIPKVKGLPELPGVPVFGSLILLGKHHARNCAKLVKKYGPVFQVRLGSRV
jgi:phenylacetate 2-hydroxylase